MFNLETARFFLPLIGRVDTTKQLIDSITLYVELLNPEDTKHLLKLDCQKMRLGNCYDSVDDLIKDIRKKW